MEIARENQKYGQAESGSAVSGQPRDIAIIREQSTKDGRKTEWSEGAFSWEC